MGIKAWTILVFSWLAVCGYILIGYGAVLFGGALLATLGTSRFLLGLGVNLSGWEESWLESNLPDVAAMEPGKRVDLVLGVVFLLLAVVLVGFHFELWSLPPTIGNALRQVDTGRGL